MRKKDSLNRQYLLLGLFLLFIILLLSIQTIGRILSGKGIFSDLFPIIFLPIYLVLMLCAFILAKRNFKHVEERRQRAIAGDASLLANPQPIPDERALPLPTILTQRVNKKALLIVVAFVVFVMLVAAFAGFLAGLSDHPATGHGHPITNPTPLFIAIGGILAGTLVVGIILFFFFWWFYNTLARREITIDEQGITTNYYGQKITMQWNEARSFAIWGIKKQPLLSFELVGDQSVIRWQIPAKVKKTPLVYTTNVPSEEYYAKLAALQQVVMAKTGLPLYDLRDQKVTWW